MTLKFDRVLEVVEVHFIKLSAAVHVGYHVHKLFCLISQW